MTWAPELLDLVKPRDRRRYDDAILTEDLIWAGLAFAGVAAGRALHGAMVNRLITIWACEAAADRATKVLRDAMELRGVEGSTWQVIAEPGSRGLKVLVWCPTPDGIDLERVQWTAFALFAGLQVGMTYPAAAS